ncbi:MAG: Na+/H+ antiporter [Anaerolineae bacterium]
MEGLADETVVIFLLLVVSLVAILVRWVRLPYTIALVLFGLLIGVLGAFPQVELTPHLILVTFLPALLFEASFHLDFESLWENFSTIATLAIPGVLLSTLIIGGILHLAIGLPLAVTLLFGALISATDPVAVLAIFGELGAPRRLSCIMEGESLFNDGTSIVLFNIILAIVLTGQFEPGESVWRFVRVAFGGAALGIAAGYLFSLLIQRIDDYLIEITLTTILAYGVYLMAEQVHISGVIAVVTAGIVLGNYGASIGMSPTTKIVLAQFWEYLAFIANSLVFLLIGLQINLPRLLQYAHPVLWGIGAVLVARVTVVYLTSLPIHRLFRPLPLAWRHILVWGGLRGAIALALALGLPPELGPWRELLRVTAFGVVFFTLVGQGTTMRPLLRRLGLMERHEKAAEYEIRWGKLYAMQAAWRRLQRMNEDGLLSDPIWRELNNEYRLLGQQLSEGIHQLYQEHEELEQQELLEARREALRAERGALQDLLRRGIISEEVYRKLAGDVDRRLDALEERTN